MTIWLAILVRLLVALILLARPLPPNEILRALAFCETYERSTTCTTWLTGAYETAGYLIRECHTTYPYPQDIQFMYCLEEYGF